MKGLRIMKKGTAKKSIIGILITLIVLALSTACVSASK